jgi:zinc transporter
MMTTNGSLTILQLDMQGGSQRSGVECLTVEKVFDRLCWVHLDYSQPDAAEWLENIDWLNPIIKDNLVDDDTRPRSFTGPSELFLSLRGVNLNPGAEPEDMIAVRLWSNDQCIITSNRRKLQSLEDVKEALGKGTGPCSAAQFVSLLVERLALRAESVIEQIEDSFDALEDSLETSDETEHRSEISQIRRQAIRLRRFLAPQREALEHLLEDAPNWIGKSDKAYIKESINRFKRYVEELDAVRDRAIVAQEELLSKFSETLNRRMYMLSLVAAIFLPLGFLTGLLGINVGGIPGANSPFGFVTICLLIAVLAGAMLAYLKTRRWF